MPEKITQKKWEDAVKACLAATETYKEKQRDGSLVEKTRHETDPPEGQRYPPKMKKPGPLPPLVKVEEIDPKARREQHDHSTPSRDFASDGKLLAHLAKHAITAARGEQARGIAALPPVEKNGVTTLSLVLVL